MPLSRIARDIRDLKRFQQIVLVLFKYRFGHFLKKTKLKRNLPLKKRLESEELEEKEKPARLRMVLEELGATFVKLGQLLSLRQDLIPKEYCDEFARLQDNVAPFPSHIAKKNIEEELKKPISELFSSFETEPIAAASIGQVHKAVLKNGQEVVIKVQRPGIKELIETDIDIMYYLAHLIEKHYHKRMIEPVDIVKEFEKYTQKELDYVLEAKNIEKCNKNFSGSRIIKIPKVYWAYTTSKVLTIEYIEGKKISEIKKDKKYSKKKIIEHLVNAMFKQIFIDGFFHADPHPGNVFVLEKNTIALLDFGIVGSLDSELKEHVTSLFIATILGDLDKIAESLIELGFVDYTINVDAFKEDLRENLSPYYDTQVKYVNIAKLFPKLIEIAKNNKIKLPANFVLLGKSLITTEGFCAELNPEFNLVRSAMPFVKSLVKIKKQPKYAFKRFKNSAWDLKDFIVKLPEQSRYLLRRIENTDISFKAIDSDLRGLSVGMDRSSSRISLGIVIAALIIGAALVINIEQPKILGISFYSFVGWVIAFFLILYFMLSFMRYKRKV